MRNFIFAMMLAVTAVPAVRIEAQTLPLYELPGNIPPKADAGLTTFMLAAAESGLYKITGGNTAIPLWTGGKVTHIARTVDSVGEKWYFVTSQGLLSSRNLQTFENTDAQIPNHVVKEYTDGKKKLVNQAQTLKGVAVHPENPDIVVTATREAVFLSRDGGTTWKNLGFSAKSAGTKTVAVANMPIKGAKNGETELVVFLSHALFGLAYLQVDVPKAQWQDVTLGFDKVPTMGYADEIADIAPVLFTREDGSTYTELFISQTFIPTIYRLNWETKGAVKLYQGKNPTDTIDGLCWTGNSLLYTRPGGISLLNVSTGAANGVPAEFNKWVAALKNVPEPVYAAYVPRNLSGFAKSLILKELWLLKPSTVYSPYAPSALGKKSLYMPANRGAESDGIDRYIAMLQKNGLNSIVIDMKDDFGLLRFRPTDPLVKEKGYVSRYAIRDDFVERFKASGIYLIARVVVFKDKHLSEYGGGKYAVWNSATNKPWVGIKGYAEDGAEPEYYDENWVDPYCEEVWEYDVRIAQDLIKLGFDEIQFDYIRFPTDGVNLYQTKYRWRDAGMDMESALISFLKYARANIDAPIGIDIYGANGWYRSGTRTGQDVELLADYVDVICPMFYPSHFEQNFLAHAPAKDRPYRIYYMGSYRTSVIARNNVIARPWLQAFYLGVSYDRAYYNTDPKFYVQSQVFGVRDSVDRGYMYWNNSGRYEDISPDITEDAPYPGSDASVPTLFKSPKQYVVDTSRQSALGG